MAVWQLVGPLTRHAIRSRHMLIRRNQNKKESERIRSQNQHGIIVEMRLFARTSNDALQPSRFANNSFGFVLRIQPDRRLYRSTQLIISLQIIIDDEEDK